MTLSVTIYFPAHCGHTGSPDWGGGVPQGRLWVDSRPRRLRPCAVLWSCIFCSDRVGGDHVVGPSNTSGLELHVFTGRYIYSDIYKIFTTARTQLKHHS